MSDDDPGAPPSSPSWEPPSGASSEPPPYAPPWQPPTHGAASGPHPQYGDQAQYGSAPPYGQMPYGQMPYGQPAYGYQPYMPPQTEGTAVVALVAAIVSWIFCPVLAAIVALVVAPGARRKIDESGGRLTGLGLLTAAKWVAWLNIAFYIGLVTLGILVAVVGGSGGGGGSDFSLGAPIVAD